MRTSPWTVNRDVVVTDDASTTAVIDMREFTRGTVYVENGSSMTSLTIHAAPEPDGTFEPLFDNTTPAAVVITVAQNRANPLPDECAGCGAIKFVGSHSETIKISLKG